MALVVFNGVQYDDSRLPAHVDPKACVPLDDWRAANRRVRTRPTMSKSAAAAKAAAPAEPESSTKARRKA